MSKEAMKLALEALRNAVFDEHTADETLEAIKALEEALAKQEQGEPLCTAAMFDDSFLAKSGLSPDTKLYTTPQQRKPLTHEQVYKLWLARFDTNKYDDVFMNFARAIEAAHGIKQ